MKKTTIQDVAAAAGVSVATVDRVLNRRAGVRYQTMEKVHSAILRLKYKPNLYAAKLSRAKAYRFLFIIRAGRNSFMNRLCEQIALISETLKDENIFIDKRLVDALDGTSAAQMLDDISPDDWDGVAVVVPDLPMVRLAIDSCVARGIKVVTVVSDLPSSARSCFVGIDNVTTGRVAGRLLGRFTCGKPGKLAVVAASLALRDHVERHMGCVQVISAEFPHLTPMMPLEGRDNPEDTFAVVKGLLESPQGKEVKALYSSGAANRGLFDALHQCGRQHDIVTVSHELTSRSRRALLDGTFDAVLSQDAGKEVQVAVQLLRQLCDNEPIERAGFIQTDIYFPDNLP